MAHSRTMMQRGTWRPEPATVVQPATSGAWLTIREYAPRRGKSVETIRRAIKADVLEAKKIIGPNGPQWLIWDGTAHSTASSNGAARCHRCRSEKRPGSACQACARRTSRRGRQ